MYYEMLEPCRYIFWFFENYLFLMIRYIYILKFLLRSGVGGVVGLGVEGADPASDCESGDGEPDTEPAENKKHSIDILL